MKKHIPNLFTLINLLFGCFAIVATMQSGISLQYSEEYGSQYLDIPEKIWMASFFIGLAAVIDFMDGFVARLLNATSELGKQLDSLADVVSFGVAPSLILFQFLRLGYAGQAEALDTPLWWLIPAFLPALAAAYRLGRFNLETESTAWFSGLPTPAAGLLVASFPLIYWNSANGNIVDIFKQPVFIISFSIIISLLMVSRLKLMSMKFSKTPAALNIARIALVAVAVTSIIFLHWLAIPAIFISYFIISLIFKKFAA